MKPLLSKRNFYTLNALTLGSVLILILVGSVVRVTGSGMGCPDWPKCFGEYAPPLTDENLPEDYQDIYKAKRLAKNERLASIFKALGFDEISYQITKDPTVHVEQRFDVQKAWIEYINRLLGALIGLFVLLNLVYSFTFWKSNRKIPFVASGVLILTLFQGWVGSLVVSTNLLHGFITFHMVLALIIVALLIWLYVRSRNLQVIQQRKLLYSNVVLLLLFIPQLLLGTEVRGTIDDLLFDNSPRGIWHDSLQNSFYIHRSFSWSLLLVAIWSFVRSRKVKERWVHKIVNYILVLVILSMLSGIAMANFSFPFWLQPLHLLFAVGIFSYLFYLILRLKRI